MSTSNNTVRTPFGLFPRSQVHLVGDGLSLSHSDDNDQIHLVDRFGSLQSTTREGESRALMGEGWITAAEWTNNSGSPLSTFSTKWRVPRPPTTQNGQIFFLFHALGPGPGDYGNLLKPVLQWGETVAGGGNYWSVASWYAYGPFSQAYYTKAVQVREGEELLGQIVLDKIRDITGPNRFIYNCSFANIVGTSLGVANIPELKTAYEGLEAYGMTQSTDYPTSNSMNMADINLTVIQRPNLHWRVKDYITDIGQKTIVRKDGATNGDVEIIWRS